MKLSDRLEPIVSEAVEANPILSTAEVAALSLAFSVKRIADAVEGFDLEFVRNRLIDIAYDAGVNFRGRS